MRALRTTTLGALLRIAAPIACAATAGCVAEAYPEPAYVEVDELPPDIAVYPHTVYDGRVVYLYGDRWYYRDGDRWAYYRSEPPALVRRRRYVVGAPAAPRAPYVSSPRITSAPAPVIAHPRVRGR